MTELIIPTETSSRDDLKVGFMDRFARNTIFSLLEKLKYGKLTLIEKSNEYTFGQESDAFNLKATIWVYHKKFFTYSLFGGSVGSGEAYMAGLWKADDLTKVIRILTLNREVFSEMEKGWARLLTPFNRLYHFFRRNTLKGSRKNIVAHYDLGNDFYKLFLDDTLTYSCGIFENENSTLKDASIAKYDRICRKLQLKPGDQVLEIGTGWGGFAIHAARNYGAHITTTTISDEQYHLAKKRIERKELTGRITLLRKDYRYLTGKFDKLVSIEMIEAVGHQYLDTFFETCGRLLKDDGMMLLQAITISDQVFDQHKHTVDFIKRYIFPGSCIPSLTAISRSMTKKTNMRLFHLEDITPHYARTLSEWRNRFFEHIDQVKKLRFSDTFIRMWDYYLSYCEGGFEERYIGNVQMLFTKPLNRRAPLLPRDI